MSANYDVIVIFTIYSQLGAIWKPHAQSVKLTFTLIATVYLTKTENRIKKSQTALTPLLSVKVLFLLKDADFL